MKCIVFNGSPRGEKSNSAVLAKWMLESVRSNSSITTQEVYLRNIQKHEEFAAKIMDADISLVIFPLYTDSMPGIVTAFIEKLQPYIGKMSGKKLGFVVHSGFSEANHSRFVEKYLIGLTKLLGADYMGTAVLGGSEPIRLMPDSMQKKTKELFNRLGESMINEGAFESDAIKKLVRVEKLTGFQLMAHKILAKTGLLNIYWNSELKKNHAYERRFARPY